VTVADFSGFGRRIDERGPAIEEQMVRRPWGIVRAVLAVGVVAIAFAAGAAWAQVGTPALTGSVSKLCVAPHSGWKWRRVNLPGTPPTIVLTNFQFGRVNYLYGHTDRNLQWKRGGILISVADWTESATPAMKRNYQTSKRLHISARDFASFEGVSNLGQTHLRFNGRLLEVWVQARPTTATTVAAANDELGRASICR
jgi:hypothetical protein